MPNLIVVGISDLKTAKGSDSLITYALGSCIGTCLYDAYAHIAGLSHILLPDSSICPEDKNIMKYANTAIEQLVKEMRRIGASVPRLTAKIAGGAKMYNTDGIGIGERNIVAVKNELLRLHIRLIAEDTGKNYGRTVEFNAADGTVYVKSVLHGVTII